MPRILLSLTALLTAIVVAAGCGNDGSSSSGATALAPAGSLMYGEATLKPEGDQKAAIEALIEKFPGEGGAGDRVRELMQKAFADLDSGLSYAKDVEPWLGDEAAFFLSALSADSEKGDGALLVATEDEDAAFAALDKAIGGKRASYKDTDYLAEDGNGAGVVDGWVVLGTEAGFKAAVDVAQDGRSMEGDEDFQRTLEDAPEERLGYVYVDLPGLADTIQRSAAGAAFGQLDRFLKEPVVATMNADRSGVRFEAVVSKDFAGGFPVMAEGADLAGELPGDSWLALAQPDLGKTIEGYIDLFASGLGGRDNLEQQFRASTGLDLQEDVLSWMGDWGLFVRGTSVAELNGALVVETSDEAASGRLIDTVARFARRSADSGERVLPLQLGGGGEGVTFRSPDVPQPIHLFQRDGKVVMAYGDEAASDALAPGRKLADSADFARAEDALGGDYNVSFYLAVAPILELVDSTDAGSDAEWQKVRSYLEPLGSLVSGAKEEGDKLRSVLGLTVD